MIKNPFYYGGVVRAEHFCNRKAELLELKTDIQTGLNILIYAPRRFGKTSLVLKAVEELKIKFVFFDFMSITSEEEFINNYFNAIVKSFDTTTDKIVRFLKQTLKITPNISVNFKENGEPSFSLNFTNQETKNVLKEVLNLPYLYAQAKKQKLAVIFDEFQEIVNIDLENKLRSEIQHHSDKVSYVFLGSKKSIMTNLFFDNSKALYKSVKHLPIKEISAKDWRKYIKAGFEENSKKIEEKHIEMILEVSRAFPYYTQQIANELFNLTDVEVSEELVKKSIYSILEKEEDLFVSEWNSLSNNQKIALKFICKISGESIYSKVNMQKSKLNNSLLKKAVEGLIKKDILDKTSNEYYLQDPLFALYISDNN